MQEMPDAPETSSDSATPQRQQAKWYLLQAFSGQENTVKLLIEEQLRLQGMEEKVEEIFIPCEEITQKKQGKERKRKITYFPGYILVKAFLDDDLWHLLQSVPKVSGFVGGTTSQPKPIKDEELLAIKGSIDSGMRQAQLNSIYKFGQTLRIVEGPFTDFNGVVENVDNEKSKLTLKVSIFGRSTPIELDFDKVRPAES